MFPAFAHVRAARAFADGVQIERAHDALQILIILAAEKSHAEPGWARMSRCGVAAAAERRFEIMLKGEAIRVVLNHVFYAHGCAGTTVGLSGAEIPSLPTGSQFAGPETAQVFPTACRYRR